MRPPRASSPGSRSRAPGRCGRTTTRATAPRVFALDRRGRFQREVTVAGAEAVDWEDIAARGRTLYVGDIGDNLAARPDVTVYRFAEPPAGVTTVAAQADRPALRRRRPRRRDAARRPAHRARSSSSPRTSAAVPASTSRRPRAGCASARRSSSASGSRSPPATSRATAARSSCAATTARSSSPAAPASRSPRALEAHAVHGRCATCSTRARASRSPSPATGARSTRCPRARGRSLRRYAAPQEQPHAEDEPGGGRDAPQHALAELRGDRARARVGDRPARAEQQRADDVPALRRDRRPGDRLAGQQRARLQHLQHAQADERRQPARR